MKVLHLFAGAGGSHLAGEMLGWESAGSVEIEPYCQAVIRHHYPEENIHGDICTYSANHLAGSVDGICGGFPCQDISAAGKGIGITGERSGLWKEYARIIGECRPSWAFIENSPLLRTRGLEVVLADLASLGYDAEWATFRASDVGAPHRRDRMFVLAYTGRIVNSALVPFSDDECDTEWRQHGCAKSVRLGRVSDRMLHQSASSNSLCDGLENIDKQATEKRAAWGDIPRQVEPCLGGVADGVAHRVDRLAALGNGWVPLQAAEAFRQLWNRACHA
jgi:DNA (cytosine-5)-methyltransferase 1